MESPAPDRKDGEVSEQQIAPEAALEHHDSHEPPADPANGDSSVLQNGPETSPDPAIDDAEPSSEPESGDASQLQNGTDPASGVERENDGGGAPEVDPGRGISTETGISPERSVSEARGGQLGAEGSRTFTMRELLNELKEENGSGSGGEIEADGGDAQREPDSSRSQDSVQQQYTGQNDVAMELINNVTGVDEEGRSRQRILSFAAKRYATAIERNPDDHDAYYNWALVLQESADNVGPDSGPSKDALLEEACKKYEEAIRLCPTLHDAYYNWAIAISDRAKLRGRTNEAEELWKQATKNYEKAVQLNWNSPQALNNWGLALQELSAIVPLKEKPSIVRTAISKFRAAIQLQFDFHRAIYNLGTVLYGLAEDTLRTGRPVNAKEVSPNELYSLSAIYIGAAHALKPNYSVYRSALRLVRSMLPLPYLKVGYLTAPPAKNPIAPHTDWERCEFVLNHEGLQQVTKDGPKSPSHSGRSADHTDRSMIKVDIPDIVSVSACADLTLPPGAGLFIDTVHRPVYLVADTWESLDGWLDAIRLVYTIFARGKSDILAGIIAS